jgi:hypothetical protein
MILVTSRQCPDIERLVGDNRFQPAILVLQLAKQAQARDLWPRLHNT